MHHITLLTLDRSYALTAASSTSLDEPAPEILQYPLSLLVIRFVSANLNVSGVQLVGRLAFIITVHQSAYDSHMSDTSLTHRVHNPRRSQSPCPH